MTARLDAQAGLHITVFQETLTEDERRSLDGFGTETGASPES